MGVLDDILGPSASMLGPQGVKGTAAMQGQPQPKKKTQQTPDTPPVAKAAPPVDLSDNPFASSATPAPTPDLSDNPFASGGRSGPDAAVQALHAEYQRGDLAKRMANENAMDAEPNGASRALGTVASLGKDIPGVEAMQAGASALANHIPYRDALHALDEAEASAPAYTRIPARVAGGTIGALATPGDAVTAAGRFGALTGLGQANPDAGVNQRLQDAAIGGLAGVTAGKAFDLAGTAIQGASATPLDAALTTAAQARTKASAPLYQQFRDLGDLGPTPALTKLVGGTDPTTGAVMDGLPIVRTAINTVKGESPTLAGLPDTHAAVLDQAYKIVGNKAWRAAQGFTKADARDALGEAMEEAAQAKGGSYADALQAYREPSQEMGAMVRGSQALQNAAKPGGAAINQAQTSSVPAFQAWLKTASPEERSAAVNGILGQLQKMPTLGRAPIPLLGRLPMPVPSEALRQAGPLMEQAGMTGSPTIARLRALITAQATAGSQP